jgi:uncharacterized repeat protein (TIGR03803 family)
MLCNRFSPTVIASFVLATLFVVFVATAASQNPNFRTIESFTGPDGSTPVAGLIRDSAGNLYGTTSSGGPYACGYGCGTVFELSPTATGWDQTVLLNFFCGGSSGVDCPKGSDPMTALIMDSKGNLYGTTRGGGTNNFGGTIFELSPATGGGWTQTVLYKFCSLANCADGSGPYGSLIFDQLGNLYGTTNSGGQGCSTGCGTVFELSPNPDGPHWTEQVLYAFTGGSDGSDPQCSLALDSAGNLYGTTYEGGANYGTTGVAFELSKEAGAWTETVIHTFDASSKDGTNPKAGMVLGPDGSLYGTTFYGGKSTEGVELGFGTVFRLTPSSDGWTETILMDFNGNNEGAHPQSGVVLDSSGNVYGTTSQGGGTKEHGVGVGVAYELQPQSDGSWHELLLHTFRNGDDGGDPNGLLLDTEGNIYGTAASGGADGHGVVFEMTMN